MHWLEHRIPPPVVALTVALAMWGAARALPGLVYTLPGREFIAFLLGVVGFAMDITGVLAFWRSRTTINPLKPGAASALVSGGLYRVTRNPMYLGMLLALAGWAVWLANAAAILLLPAFVLYINRFQIAPEERILEAKFGTAFTDYKARVRRWL